MQAENPFADLIPGARTPPRGQPRPIIAPQPSPQTPVAAATDAANLERIRLANEAARREAAGATEPAYPQSALDAFDRAVASIDRLGGHEGLPAAVGRLSFNPSDIAAGQIPFGTVFSETGTASGTPARNFISELEALKAQVFLPMVQAMRGMGALSNMEGQRLTDAIGAMNVNMGERAFQESLARIRADLLRYRERGAGGTAAPAAPPWVANLGLDAPPPSDDQRPDGTPMFGDEARPPEREPNPENDTFRATFEAAVNAGQFRNADEALAYATQLNPAIGARMNRAEVQRAVANVRSGGRVIVTLPPEADRSPPITDVRGGENAEPIAYIGAGAVGVSTEDVDAGVRGAFDIPSVGLGDEIFAASDTLFRGGTYGENLWRQRGIDDYDQENNPRARMTGQLIGSFGLPTGVGRAAFGAGRTALRGGATRAIARYEAGRAGARRLGAEGAAFGGAYGFGSGEGGVESRLASGGISALIGGGAGYGIGRGIGAAVGRYGRGSESAAGAPVVGEADAIAQREAAQSAAALDINMPRFIAGSPADQAMGARAEQSAFGGSTIRRATARFTGEARDARDRVASDVGEAVETPGMGEAAASGAQRYLRYSRAERSQAYRQAEEAAAGADFQATGTIQTIGRLLREEGEVIGGTDALPVLEHYARALEAPGGLTIKGARGMRTALRERLGTVGMSPTNADRITTQVMNAVRGDIERSLVSSGREAAIPLYRTADDLAREGADIRRNVLTPILGRNMDRTGEDAARALQNAAQGNGTRLQTFLGTIPRDEASMIRSTLISQLGRSTSGRQNAPGDAFSLDTFLTNWDQIRNARGKIFDRKTVSSLNHLANVARQARTAGERRGFSNTGAILSGMLTSTPATLGVGTTLATGDVKMMAVGAAVTAGVALRQYVKASLLASPTFARRLANTPNNPVRARAHWSGPWVEQLARTEPAIASDLLGFQQAALRQFGSASSASQATRAAAEENDDVR